MTTNHTPFHPGRSQLARGLATQQRFASIYTAQRAPVPHHILKNCRSIAATLIARGLA